MDSVDSLCSVLDVNIYIIEKLKQLKNSKTDSQAVVTEWFLCNETTLCDEDVISMKEEIGEMFQDLKNYKWHFRRETWNFPSRGTDYWVLRLYRESIVWIECKLDPNETGDHIEEI